MYLMFTKIYLILNLIQAWPAQAAFLIDDYLKSTVTILNLKYLPPSQFCYVSAYVLSLSPNKQMCFEAYK